MYICLPYMCSKCEQPLLEDFDVKQYTVHTPGYLEPCRERTLLCWDQALVNSSKLKHRGNNFCTLWPSDFVWMRKWLPVVEKFVVPEWVDQSTWWEMALGMRGEVRPVYFAEVRTEHISTILFTLFCMTHCYGHQRKLKSNQIKSSDLVSTAKQHISNQWLITFISFVNKSDWIMKVYFPEVRIEDFSTILQLILHDSTLVK